MTTEQEQAIMRIFCQICRDVRNGKRKDIDYYVGKMMVVTFGKNWKKQLKKGTNQNG